MKLDIIAIKNLLINQLGNEVIAGESLDGLQPLLLIHPNAIKAVCKTLKENEQTWFDFLACITAIDLGPEQGFSLVYHLTSIPYKNQLTLEVRLPNLREQTHLPSLDSVVDIWKTANWHEREAFDLMGIFFQGHPDLRRLLLPDDWEGYPLRKDYQDAEKYHGIHLK